jgi:hypothetical protein
MPNVLASLAAVSGSSVGTLFTPSVNRMMVRLGDVDRCSRDTAVARPRPMAVPSSTRPTLISSRKPVSTGWSRVSGHCVKARAAKTTSPIWS